MEKIKGMTNAQLNGYLELIAKLIEAKAITLEEAAKIVREAKVQKPTKKKSLFRIRPNNRNRQDKSGAVNLPPLRTLIISRQDEKSKTKSKGESHDGKRID